MAFHGDLVDIDIADVISLISGKSGVLTLGPVQGKTLNIHVTAGLIASFSVEQRIDRKQNIVGLIERFMRDRPAFSFEHRPIYSTHALHLALDQLFLSKDAPQCSTAPDAIKLPEPDTVFMLIKARKVELPLELRRFLDMTAPMLEKGASANAISRRTKMQLRDVQLALHGLRQAKKAWPAFAGASLSNETAAGTRIFAWLFRSRSASATSG